MQVINITLVLPTNHSLKDLQDAIFEAIMDARANPAPESVSVSSEGIENAKW